MECNLKGMEWNKMNQHDVEWTMECDVACCGSPVTTRFNVGNIGCVSRYRVTADSDRNVIEYLVV